MRSRPWRHQRAERGATTVRVAAVGGDVDVPDLRAALPRNWAVAPAECVAADEDVDLVLVSGDVPGSVAAARTRWPAAALLASVAESRGTGDGSRVVAALRAGADGCVRGGRTALVALYLVALARQRRLVS